MEDQPARDGKKLSTSTTVSVIIATVVILIVGYYTVPNLFPKSGDEKYESDRKRLQVAVLAYHSGYLANAPKSAERGATADARAGTYPTWAKQKKGLSNAVKEEDAGSEPLSTLLLTGSNPTGSKGQSRTPIWEDVDGDGKRTRGAEVLYHHAADPIPTTDHWNTTTVTRDGTSYVVDSRDWFIDVDELVKNSYLRSKLESASPDNTPGGTGNYSWYVDDEGTVRSMLYAAPTSATHGYQGFYP